MSVAHVNWDEFGKPYCNVYVIAADGRWPCKIGVAKAPQRRLSDLQTSHWKELSVVHAVWFPDAKEARRVEAKAHRMLKEDGRALRGEWFDRTPEQCLEVIRFAALSLDAEVGEVLPDDVRPIIEERLNVRAAIEQAKQHQAFLGHLHERDGSGGVDYGF